MFGFFGKTTFQKKGFSDSVAPLHSLCWLWEADQRITWSLHPERSSGKNTNLDLWQFIIQLHWISCMDTCCFLLKSITSVAINASNPGSVILSKGQAGKPASQAQYGSTWTFAQKRCFAGTWSIKLMANPITLMLSERILYHFENTKLWNVKDSQYLLPIS